MAWAKLEPSWVPMGPQKGAPKRPKTERRREEERREEKKGEVKTGKVQRGKKKATKHNTAVTSQAVWGGETDEGDPSKRLQDRPKRPQ